MKRIINLMPLLDVCLIMIFWFIINANFEQENIKAQAENNVNEIKTELENANAEIDGLSEKVAELEERLSEKEEDYSLLMAEKTELEEELIQAEDRISQVEDELDNIEVYREYIDRTEKGTTLVVISLKAVDNLSPRDITIISDGNKVFSATLTNENREEVVSDMKDVIENKILADASGETMLMFVMDSYLVLKKDKDRIELLIQEICKGRPWIYNGIIGY